MQKQPFSAGSVRGKGRSDFAKARNGSRGHGIRGILSDIYEFAEKRGMSKDEVFGLLQKESKRFTLDRWRNEQAGSSYYYRHPEDPLKIWSGNGRMPEWVRELLGRGVDLDEIRVSVK
ncbi:H-NS histone family protein [Candidatus Parcubacteria bacterium]|nr:MAG: H-NS histone family protein [Candidatus Parcubacteria bacterium]